ncbi:MAG: ABC transporter ATP-binding protein/permease [Alphaproteobacteria bacterium]|nr:ABC transporter ATP-binding protein/permease [Alphaproteobacteria bacterium]
MTTLSTARRLLGLIDRERIVLPLVIGLGVLGALLESVGLYLFVPLVQGLSGAPIRLPFPAVNAWIAGFPPDMRVGLFAGLIVVCIVAKNVLAYLCAVLWFSAQSQVVHKVQTRIFEQLVRSGADYAADSARATRISAIASESWKLGDATVAVFRTIVAVITCVIFAGLLFVISWRLTLLALAAMAIAAAILFAITRTAQKVGEDSLAALNTFGKHAWESFNALRTIRAFGRESYEIERLRRHSEDVRRGAMRQEMLWALPWRFGEVSATLIVAALILTVGRDPQGLALFVAFLAVLYRMQAPLREALSARVQMNGLQPVAAQVFSIMDETARPVLVSGSRAFAGMKDGIRLENVRFRYAEGEAEVLRGLTLDIPAGKTTAIVGPSGAGKSTLIDLLARFRDPTDGVVRVDGVDLREFDLAQWRAHMSIMSQDVFLFDASVRDNVLYGDATADDDALSHAARIARADAFIEALPEGWNTRVGDRGGRLSGGQRQRIALARAVVRNPDLFLLDEATNALDAETERAFQAALAEFSRGRTLVVVAHRLATIEAADQIVMMEAGVVIESGSFADLIGKRGRFWRLYEAQRLATAAE